MKLRDITLNITDGKHGDCNSQEGSGYYFISCKDVSNGRINYNGARQITYEDFIDVHRRTRLELDDVLITNSGTIGRMCFVDESVKIGYTVFQKSVAIIKPNPEKVIPNYLYYYLYRSVDILVRRAYGSSQKNLLLSELRSLNVNIPQLDTQKMIVSQIKPYDDKIQLNIDLINAIKEYAQLIYHKWFVDFNFPNENGDPYKDFDGQMKNTGEKEIPIDWDFDSITKLGEIVLGGTPPTENEKFFCKCGIPWITPKDLSVNKCMHISRGNLDITDDGLRNSSARIVPKGTVLMSSRAPIGYLSIAKNSLTTNQGFKSITPKSGISSEFIYYTLQSLMPKIKRIASGSTFKEVSKEMMSKLKVIIPEKPILLKYDDIIRPISNKIKILEEENNHLIETRDLLIRKLINK
ncbi:restriction endonuclease subunit S [Paenibacillus peoriae]|uniref:restriction endonuclease subunit S n=1 Tax=Paenibacillus peoriae TaxID=59893 RepID=UPI00026C648A|nr:restriction endonuclease subunit S [Paenibacillus peoriae]MEC0182598.1 restriction endonuclease subunit S [Paenibacillus peoriae]